MERGFQEAVLPSLGEQAMFVEKAGPEIIDQMYAFQDKGQRDICLIPEATALVQQQWNKAWCKSMPRPMRLFYVQRCYRYERPQAGRYREFTQAGIEILGGVSPGDKVEAVELLRLCLDALGVNYTLNESVRRGLSYYVEEGFEAEVASLGAQKQVAGGGRYREGVGWAIGVDRVMLA
jgi:histidyl-tRNA synthetase